MLSFDNYNCGLDRSKCKRFMTVIFLNHFWFNQQQFPVRRTGKAKLTTGGLSHIGERDQWNGEM